MGNKASQLQLTRKAVMRFPEQLRQGLEHSWRFLLQMYEASMSASDRYASSLEPKHALAGLILDPFTQQGNMGSGS